MIYDSRGIYNASYSNPYISYNYIDGGYRDKIRNNKCEICGDLKKKHIIHHKDGNRKNNNKDNLQCLCYKCHTEVHLKMNNHKNIINWNNPEEVKAYQKGYAKRRR